MFPHPGKASVDYTPNPWRLVGFTRIFPSRKRESPGRIDRGFHGSCSFPSAVNPAAYQVSVPWQVGVHDRVDAT